jgi:uncharacterized paraquat-inducible protein A
MTDDTRPVTFTLVSAIQTLAESGRVALACVAAVCFLLIPAAECVLRVRHRSDGHPPKRDPEGLWPSIRSWNLLPVMVAGLAIVALKQAKQGAVIRPEYGFFLIAACLLLRSLPDWKRRLKICGRWVADPKPVTRIVPVAPTRAARHLAYLSLAALIAGLSLPFFCLNIRMEGGLIESIIARISDIEISQEFSILNGIRMLWDAGDRLIVAILVLASVAFPLAKTFALLWFLRRSNRPRLPYLHLLKQLGPWSMLDAVVVMLIAVAYCDFPGGTSLTLLCAYWIFVTSILLNSLALALTRYSFDTTAHTGLIPGEPPP